MAEDLEFASACDADQRDAVAAVRIASAVGAMMTPAPPVLR
jgi:hypothetical protein